LIHKLKQIETCIEHATYSTRDARGTLYTHSGEIPFSSDLALFRWAGGRFHVHARQRPSERRARRGMSLVQHEWLLTDKRLSMNRRLRINAAGWDAAAGWLRRSIATCHPRPRLPHIADRDGSRCDGRTSHRDRSGDPFRWCPLEANRTLASYATPFICTFARSIWSLKRTWVSIGGNRSSIASDWGALESLFHS